MVVLLSEVEVKVLHSGYDLHSEWKSSKTYIKEYAILSLTVVPSPTLLPDFTPAKPYIKSVLGL